MIKTIPTVGRGHKVRAAMLIIVATICLNSYSKELDKPLRFEQVFSDRGEPAALHYQATFTSNGASHQLEIWREGELRLKRITDDTIESHVVHKPGDPEFQITVLDLKQRILTRINRSNLYRIGNFTDWFDLAHGIKYPRGLYQLSKGTQPEGVPKAIKPCNWFDLTEGHRTTHICWSTKNRLPLLMSASGRQIVWQVTKLERKPIASKTFEIHDKGFIRNNANQDIERD